MGDEKEIMTGVALEDDAAVEPKLRPQTLSEYIGQTKVRENLSVFLAAARGRREPLDHVLLTGPPGLGETTRPGLLSQPLHARFGISLRLDFYDAAALTLIVERSAQILGIPIAADAAREIASRSRGTPRIANRLLRRLRDFAEVAGKSSIDLGTAREALRRLEVDEHGFDELDRRILSTIIEKFGGGPVGIASIAASIGEDRGTLEDLYEPYLIQAGFLQRTPRGRVASALAYRHLGIVPPRRDGSLF